MKSSSRKRHITIYIAVALLILTSLSFCMNFGIFARFTDTENTNSSARVAVFSVGVGDTYTTDSILFENIWPGKTQSYQFRVTSSSEVAVRCLVRIESTKNLPLVYSINGVVLEAGDLTMKSVIDIQPNKGAVDLTLKAFWPSDENDLSYLAEIEVVRLFISIQQID